MLLRTLGVYAVGDESFFVLECILIAQHMFKSVCCLDFASDLLGALMIPSQLPKYEKFYTFGCWNICSSPS